MLRIVPSTNANAAIKYFDEGLSRGDYYAQGQECTGTWHGKGAWQLGLTGEGLSGEVTREQFAAMCNNVHPTSGGPLTQRTMGNRRVGYDFNFHPPKSFSIVHQETQANDMLEAFKSSVIETMEQVEQDMKCRVRLGGAQHDRTVGNLSYALFIHHTSRPVDGFPDQHTHAHAFAFNSVWDGIEQKWKAGQFGDIKRDAPYYEAFFHSRLASKLVALGFEIERRGKSWEIAAVPEQLIRECSRRTNEIEAKAREQGITDAKRKSELGAKTRKHKDKSLSMEKLREIWSQRIDAKTKSEIHRARRPGGGRFGAGIERDPGAAIDFAAGKLFERQSVVSEKKILEEAMRRCFGAVSLDALQRVIQRDAQFIVKEKDGERKVTTKEVLAEEERMIAFARDGRGTQIPLAPSHVIKDCKLNDQQRAAVMHVLQTTDRVAIIRGGAGTGKTTLMSEAIGAMNASWLERALNGGDFVTVLAPSADASRDVLRREGFSNADTVAKFLANKKMQEGAKGGVLWIDEAGLVGSRTMAQVFRVADQLGARIVLSGDRAQHRSVERGDPLRLLQDYAGVVPIHVEKIQRQRGLYKSAVDHLSRGNVAQGFEGLRKLGFIQEVSESEAHRRIAYDYVTTIESGRSALVVSPTHAEGRNVTNSIRAELERRESLKGPSRMFDRLEDLRWTQAERATSDNYEQGLVVQFHQNVVGFKAGTKYKVVGHVPGVGITLNNLRVLPLDRAHQFNVYKFHEQDTELKKGDLIRVTANGRSIKAPAKAFHSRRQHALNNGAAYKVAGFTASGNIRLENGWVIHKKYGHFTHGYCATSHSSQGKTVDRVFIAQSANSFGATSAEQFYVSVSRGRKECVVYTDDVEGLRRQIGKTTRKPLAVELAARDGRELEDLVISAAKQAAKERESQRHQERQREQHREQEHALVR